MTTGKILSIRAARKRAGLTQEDLSKLVGLPQPVICFIENGKVAVLEKDRSRWEWALAAEGKIDWKELEE